MSRHERCLCSCLIFHYLQVVETFQADFCGHFCTKKDPLFFQNQPKTLDLILFSNLGTRTPGATGSANRCQGHLLNLFKFKSSQTFLDHFPTNASLPNFNRQASSYKAIEEVLISGALAIDVIEDLARKLYSMHDPD